MPRGPTLLVAAFVAAIALACSEPDPPPVGPERGPCLPVLDPCGDCLDACSFGFEPTPGHFALGDPRVTTEGQMGTSEPAVTIVEHCTGEPDSAERTCARVYRRPLRACYGSCGGSLAIPTCAVRDDACVAIDR